MSMKYLVAGALLRAGSVDAAETALSRLADNEPGISLPLSLLLIGMTLAGLGRWRRYARKPPH